MKKNSIVFFLLLMVCAVNGQKSLVTAKITDGIYHIYNEGVGKYMELQGAWSTTPAYNKKLMFDESIKSTSSFGGLGGAAFANKLKAAYKDKPDSYFYVKKVGDHYVMHPMNCNHKVGPMVDAGLLWQIVGTHLKAHLDFCDVNIESVTGKMGVYRIGLKKEAKYWHAFAGKKVAGKMSDSYVSHGDIEKNNLMQQWKFEKLSSPYAHVDSNQKFMVKSASSGYYWDLKGDSDNSTNRNGTILWMSDKMLHTNDKRYKFKKDNGKWVYIQVQNGGRNINVDKSNLYTKGQQLELWDRKSDLRGQRYSIIPTSPTTCIFVTYTGLALQNISQKVKQNVLNFEPAQHWQLIYADGPNKGKPYSFKQ